MDQSHQTQNRLIVEQAFALVEGVGPTGLSENDLDLEEQEEPKLDARMKNGESSATDSENLMFKVLYTFLEFTLFRFYYDF